MPWGSKALHLVWQSFLSESHILHNMMKLASENLTVFLTISHLFWSNTSISLAKAIIILQQGQCCRDPHPLPIFLVHHYCYDDCCSFISFCCLGRFYLEKVNHSGQGLPFCFVLAQHVAQWGFSPQSESQSAIAKQSDKKINKPKVAIGVSSLV